MEAVRVGSPTEAATAARSSAQVGRWLERNWFWVFSGLYALFVGLPFLAPVFMQMGWETPARWIYTFYSFLCHQLPQRSFFLFGPKFMYSLEEIQAVWPADNPLVLRQFIGTPEMGWKVAWSDRMVSMYTAVLFFAWLWWPLRHRIRPLAWWGLALFLLPMAIDGGTHLISDALYGVDQGFRYTNEWLARLTNYAFPRSFYEGNALGSFNSWMRLITGVLFGIGVVWFFFPRLHQELMAVQAARVRMQALRQQALENIRQQALSNRS